MEKDKSEDKKENRNNKGLIIPIAFLSLVGGISSGALITNNHDRIIEVYNGIEKNIESNVNQAMNKILGREDPSSIQPTITAKYPIDLDRDGCADRIMLGKKGIYVQTHSVFKYGFSAGFNDPMLVVPIDNAKNLTDIIVTHYDHDGLLDFLYYIRENQCVLGDGFREYVALGKGDGTFGHPQKHYCNGTRKFSIGFYQLER